MKENRNTALLISFPKSSPTPHTGLKKPPTISSSVDDSLLLSLLTAAQSAVSPTCAKAMNSTGTSLPTAVKTPSRRLSMSVMVGMISARS